MYDPSLNARPDDRELLDLLPDATAREQLVERHRPLGIGLAKRYVGMGEPLDDLVQVASLGLLKAIDRYDSTQGTPFSAYAVPTILGELKRHFRDRGWSVRMPRRLQEHALKVRDLIPSLYQRFSRSPTVAEVAGAVDLTEDETVQALEALEAYSTISLDAPVDEEGTTPIRDLIATDDDLEAAEGWVDLVRYIRDIPERERRLLVLRFFEGWSQSQIGKELGISQVHVSRLLSQTCRRLREATRVEA